MACAGAAGRQLAGLPRALLLTLGAAVLVVIGTVVAGVRVPRDCHPVEVHLALTGSPGEMAVSWRTSSLGCESEVLYALGGAPANGGPDVGDLDLVAIGHASSHNSSELCASPANHAYQVLHAHSAVLTGLDAPGQEVRYRVGRLGEVRNFRAPLPGGDNTSYSFLAYGDMGFGKKGPGAASVVSALGKAVREGGDRMIVHVGDLSYADGKWDYWAGFMEEVEPLASAMPYMISVGNHEYSPWSTASVDAWGQPVYMPHIGDFSDKDGGECGLATAWRFRMPGQGNVPERRSVGEGSSPKVSVSRRALMSTKSLSQGDQMGTQPLSQGDKIEAQPPPQGKQNGTQAAPHGVPMEIESLPRGDQNWTQPLPQGPSKEPQPLSPFWYSFEYGKVHFTVLSTEHDLAQDSLQYAWVAADLASVDRCRTPWLLVFMHRPPYVPHPNKHNREFGALLRTEVEGLFSSHNVTAVVSGHLHLYARTCTVFNGTCMDDAAGGVPYLIVGTAGHSIGEVEDNAKDSQWLEEYLLQYGFGRFTVHGDERLSFSFFGTDSTTAVDSVELVERGVCNRNRSPLSVV